MLGTCTLSVHLVCESWTTLRIHVLSATDPESPLLLLRQAACVGSLLRLCAAHPQTPEAHCFFYDKLPPLDPRPYDNAVEYAKLKTGEAWYKLVCVGVVEDR